jgi:hypothetical protein
MLTASIRQFGFGERVQWNAPSLDSGHGANRCDATSFVVGAVDLLDWGGIREL